MCQSELDERANCLRMKLIKPQQKWLFLSVGVLEHHQITDKNSSLESFKAYTKSGGGRRPGRAGRGLTSKGKLLGCALGLNAYAHAVCIVWHWSAPAITA